MTNTTPNLEICVTFAYILNYKILIISGLFSYEIKDSKNTKTKHFVD